MAEVPNKVSAELTDNELAECLSLVDQLEAKLPFLLALEDGEHKDLPKLGDAALGFVNTGHGLVLQRTDFLPGSFKVEEMTRDVDLLNKLVQLRTRLSPFVKKIRDTTMVVGSEAYKASLVVYKNGQTNGSADIQPVIQEMGQLFKRASTEKAEGE